MGRRATCGHSSTNEACIVCNGNIIYGHCFLPHIRNQYHGPPSLQEEARPVLLELIDIQLGRVLSYVGLRNSVGKCMVFGVLSLCFPNRN